MRDLVQKYSFEAIYGTLGRPIHDEIGVCASGLDEAWDEATRIAKESSAEKDAVLVAMVLLKLELIDEPAPFETPYRIDSPLWSMSFAKKN